MYEIKQMSLIFLTLTADSNGTGFSLPPATPCGGKRCQEVGWRVEGGEWGGGRRGDGKGGAGGASLCLSGENVGPCVEHPDPLAETCEPSHRLSQ